MPDDFSSTYQDEGVSYEAVAPVAETVDLHSLAETVAGETVAASADELRGVAYEVASQTVAAERAADESEQADVPESTTVVIDSVQWSDLLAAHQAMHDELQGIFLSCSLCLVACMACVGCMLWRFSVGR